MIIYIMMRIKIPKNVPFRESLEQKRKKLEKKRKVIEKELEYAKAERELAEEEVRLKRLTEELHPKHQRLKKLKGEMEGLVSFMGKIAEERRAEHEKEMRKLKKSVA
jgi:chromosome segregation ATPase